MKSKWTAGLALVFVLVALTMDVTGRANQKQGFNESPADILKRVEQAYQKKPVNARVDPVWKLIPALNGVKLNKKETLAGWNGKNPGATPLVFEQIPASVSTEKYANEPIYHGNTGKRQMALMFNVAWGEEHLATVLQILKKHHVNATFFVDGKWAATHQSQLQEIKNAGMEIGNHGYQHHLFSGLSKSQMMADFSRTNAIIRSVTGISPNLFAPPAGDFTPLTVKVAAGLGMKTILWTIDTVDWKRPQPEVIAMRVLIKKSPGAMVLMHPTQPTTKALSNIIANLQAERYQLVTVSQLLSPLRPVPQTLSEA